MIDLNNTWCEATEENYKKLLNLNCPEGINLNIKTDKYIYIDEYKQVQSTSLNIGIIVDLKIYKQIHLVNGEFQYVETKPKNNFKDYGFEADFEGEILKEVKELKGIEYLGYFVGGNKTYYPCIWTKSGRIWKTSVSEKDRELYNLKPIKKEWYENPDNAGKLVSINETLGIFKSYAKENETIIYTSLVNNLEYIIHISKCRPATKEEVLSLLVKEE